MQRSQQLEELEKILIEQLNDNSQLSFEENRSRLREFISGVNNFISNIFGAEEEGVDFLNKGAVKNLQKIDYLKLRNKKVLVPKNFNDTYIGYIGSLETVAQDVVVRVPDKALNPLRRGISRFLNDPDTLSSNRYSEHLEQILTFDLKDYREKIAQHFFSDESEYRAYSILVENQNQWSEIENRFNDLITQTYQYSRDDMLKTVDEIATMVDKLLDRIENQPEDYEISPEKLKEIQTYLFKTAEAVEFVSGFRYMLHELRMSFSYALEQLPNKV